MIRCLIVDLLERRCNNWTINKTVSRQAEGPSTLKEIEAKWKQDTGDKSSLHKTRSTGANVKAAGNSVPMDEWATVPTRGKNTKKNSATGAGIRTQINSSAFLQRATTSPATHFGDLKKSKSSSKSTKTTKK